MDKVGVHVVINVIVIILLLGVFYRVQMNEVEVLQETIQNQLNMINKSISLTQQVLFQQITKMKADNALEFSSVRKQLSDSLELVQAAIQSVDQESKRKIGSLEVQLYQVESTKEASISKLQRQLGEITAGVGDFSLLIDTAKDSVVRVETPSQTGSGMIIDQAGYIVTNAHVLDASPITIVYPDRSFETAEIVGLDKEADIAVLKADNKKQYPALSFGNSNLLDIGEPVVALGFPGGLDLSVSQGVISATNRLGTNNIPLFQTDVAISLGSSGGPLINRFGEVIGINVGIHYLNLLGYERFGFSIKGNYAKRKIQEIHPGLLS